MRYFEPWTVIRPCRLFPGLGHSWLGREQAPDLGQNCPLVLKRHPVHPVFQDIWSHATSNALACRLHHVAFKCLCAQRAWNQRAVFTWAPDMAVCLKGLHVSGDPQIREWLPDLRLHTPFCTSIFKGHARSWASCEYNEPKIWEYQGTLARSCHNFK